MTYVHYLFHKYSVSMPRRLHKCLLVPGCTFQGSRQNLQAHERVHTGIRPYACPTCKYTCKQQAQLTVHKRTHTDFELCCPEPGCTYKAKMSSNMKRHSRTHSEQRDFPCSVCSYSAKHKCQLQMHEFVHRPYAERPLFCMAAECTFRSTTQQNLLRHVAIGKCPDKDAASSHHVRGANGRGAGEE